METPTNLINKIESLNLRDYNDLIYLSKDIYNSINEIRTEIKKDFYDNIEKSGVKVVDRGSNEDYKSYELKMNSFEVLINIYTKKCREFNSKFYDNEELIRVVIKEYLESDRNLLKKFSLEKQLLLFPLVIPLSITSLNFMNQFSDSNNYNREYMDLTMFVNKNLKTDYYLKPKINPKEGCFIATYVYDSYDNENVLILRNFRDEVLLKTFTGRKFVSI